MKILQLVASSCGGAASHVRDLALGLPKDLYSVAVAMPEDTGNVCAEDFRHASVRFFPLGIEKGFNLRAFFRLRDLLMRERFDIVHAHGARAAFWARLALTALPSRWPRLIYTIHGFMIPHYPLLKRVILYLQEKWQAPQTDCFIAVSEAERVNFCRSGLGVTSEVQVIRYGIQAEPFAGPARPPGETRAQFLIDDRTIVLAMTCRFYWPRDFPTLLRGIELATKEIPNLKLLLIGEGPWRGRIESLIRELNLYDIVILTGIRRDIADILHASDIFVFTSAGGDGLPIAILEAMAASRPVIATASDGIPEEVIDGQSGLLVAPKDPASLAGAIVSLASDKPRRNRMAERGLAQMHEHFTLKEMTSKLCLLYRAIAERESRVSFPES